MEKGKQWFFQEEIRYQCELVLMAYCSIVESSNAGNVDAVFYHVQMLLSGVASTSKMLWGQDDKGKARKDRASLREYLGAYDSSPFSPSGAIGRRMRNNYEHYDERLDKWWNTSKTHSYVERAVLGRKSTFSKPRDKSSFFRTFDIATGEIGFWEETVSIEEVIRETRRILAALGSPGFPPALGD